MLQKKRRYWGKGRCFESHIPLKMIEHNEGAVLGVQLHKDLSQRANRKQSANPFARFVFRYVIDNCITKLSRAGQKLFDCLNVILITSLQLN